MLDNCTPDIIDWKSVTAATVLRAFSSGKLGGMAPCYNSGAAAVPRTAAPGVGRRLRASDGVSGRRESAAVGRESAAVGRQQLVPLRSAAGGWRVCAVSPTPTAAPPRTRRMVRDAVLIAGPPTPTPDGLTVPLSECQSGPGGPFLG